MYLFIEEGVSSHRVLHEYSVLFRNKKSFVNIFLFVDFLDFLNENIFAKHKEKSSSKETEFEVHDNESKCNTTDNSESGRPPGYYIKELVDDPYNRIEALAKIICYRAEFEYLQLSLGVLHDLGLLLDGVFPLDREGGVITILLKQLF